MFRKRTRTTALVVFLLMIVISAAMLFIRYPSKFEIIYGRISAMMAAIALYLSMHSLDVAESAQKDSSRSADATEESTVIARQAREDSKLSAEVARDALQLALAEQAIARERYRSERGPLLNIQKQQMLFPLKAPFAQLKEQNFDDVESKWNYSTVNIINEGTGTATTIDLSWDFVNAEEYHDFSFYTSEIKRPTSFMKVIGFGDRGFSRYGLRFMFVKNGDLDILEFHGEMENVVRDDKQKGRVRRLRYKKSDAPRRIGVLKSGEASSFDLPLHYRILAHQFFLERLMVMSEDKQLDENATEKIEVWKTPNPRLRVRLQYIDTVLEHMNDFKEATRVKEFEITCSEVVRSITLFEHERPIDFSNKAINSHFNIQMIYDRPLSEIQAEEASIGGEEPDGSTGPTEE